MRCMQMSEGLTTADINPGDNGRSFVIETAAVCTAPHSYVCLLHPTVYVPHSEILPCYT